MSGQQDEVILATASREKRVLLTDDKDFGELVYRRKLVTQGILLVRLSSPSIDDRLKRLSTVWGAIEPHLPGRFVVIGDEKVRIRPITISP